MPISIKFLIISYDIPSNMEFLLKLIINDSIETCIFVISFKYSGITIHLFFPSFAFSIILYLIKMRCDSQNVVKTCTLMNENERNIIYFDAKISRNCLCKSGSGCPLQKFFDLFPMQ